MILTIEIDKEASGSYTVRALANGVEARSPQSYSRIHEAIRAESQSAIGFADFVEIRYGGMSSGTYSASQLALEAEQVADRLVALRQEMTQLEVRRLMLGSL